MEMCPKCHFKKVRKVVKRDPDNHAVVIATASVCINCGFTLRLKEYDK